MVTLAATAAANLVTTLEVGACGVSHLEPNSVESAHVAVGEGVGGEVVYATVTPDRFVPRHRLSTDTNSSMNLIDSVLENHFRRWSSKVESTRFTDQLRN